MADSVIRRSPSGAFISRDAVVSAWLPLMLSWIWNDPLTAALHAMQRFCINKFAEQYRILHSSLDWEGSTGLDTTGHFQREKHADAQKWLKRRDILQKAIEELKALDQEALKP